jgi:biotin carboxyl carrier protein
MAKIEIKNTTFDVHKDEENVLLNGEIAAYNLIKLPNNEYHLILDGKSYTIALTDKNSSKGELHFTINGRSMSTRLDNKLAELLKSMGMETGKKKLKELKAPMPGLVLNVLIKSGDEVVEGQELIVLEAMKMENAIKSPQAGVIDQVSVVNHDKVEKNQLLLSFV